MYLLPRAHVVTVAGASLHAAIAADKYKRRRIANNGLIIANSSNSIRLVCVSNSSQPDVGVITGLDGNALTSGSGWDVNNGGDVPGFIRATNTAFTVDNQGIYTCTISYNNGNVMVFNVGLYPTAFSGECVSVMPVQTAERTLSLGGVHCVCDLHYYTWHCAVFFLSSSQCLPPSPLRHTRRSLTL